MDEVAAPVFQWQVYEGVPPVGATEAEPLLPLLQDTAVPPQEAFKAKGWVTVKEQVVVQL